MGAVLGAPGIAVGAAVGALAGAVSGGAEIFESKDQAFKNYVQEAAEGQLSAQKEAVTSGSSIAGGREQKQMAFTTLLGSEEEAAAFLADVQDMAAMTNYTYDEITGYAKSLVKPFGADKSLDILTTLSDASAALSLNESDNAVLIAGLSRMKLTDKTTQEYLNYFSERGIDVYEALSKWGDAAAVAEKVTRGEIRGSEAVEEILAYMQEQYGGLSEQMAGTYAGMVDNLADAEANAEAAYGEGYNEKRKEGIQAQMDWLNSGAMDEANRAIGAWQAELENTKEQYQREAMEAMMETDEYQQAQAEGDAAEMGRLIMQAKVQGMNEYNASEGAQLALESELALAAAIRDDARSDQAYWDAGYRKSQEYSKGLAAGMASALVGTGSETTTGLSVEERRYGNWRRGGYYDEDGDFIYYTSGRASDTDYKVDFLTVRTPKKRTDSTVSDGEVVLLDNENTDSGDSTDSTDGSGSTDTAVTDTIVTDAATVQLSFRLLVNSDNAFKVAAAKQVAASWNSLNGVNVTVDEEPYDTYVSMLQSGSFDAYYGETQLTPDFDLRPLLSPQGGLNYGSYSSEDMSNAITAYRSGENTEGLYTTFLNEMPLIPLAFERQQVVLRSGLINHFNPAPYNAFAGQENWVKP